MSKFFKIIFQSSFFSFLLFLFLTVTYANFNIEKEHVDGGSIGNMSAGSISSNFNEPIIGGSTDLKSGFFHGIYEPPEINYKLNEEIEDNTNLYTGYITLGGWSNEISPIVNVEIRDINEGTVSFYLQMDDNSDFSSPECDYSETIVLSGPNYEEHNIDPFSGGGACSSIGTEDSIYIRVRVVDASDISSSWFILNDPSEAYRIDISGNTPTDDFVEGSWLNTDANIEISSGANLLSPETFYYIQNSAVPLIHWDFNSDISNRMLTGYNGTSIVGTGIGAGQVGNSISFDGVDDKFDFTPIGPGENDDFTWSFWVNPTNKETQVFVGLGQNYAGIMYGGLSQNINLGTGGGGTVSWTSTNVVPNTWSHVAIRVQGGTSAELLVNGVSEGIRDISGFTYYWDYLGNRNFQRIGLDYGTYGNHFQGSMDEIKYFESSLTDAQILEEMLTTYATPITISTEGVTQLSYFSTDEAGNTSISSYKNIQLDKTVPLGVTGLGGDSSTNSNPILEWTEAEDDPTNVGGDLELTSRVNQYLIFRDAVQVGTVSDDGSSDFSYTDTDSLAEGSYFYQVQVEDNAGNVQTVGNIFEIIVDQVSPTGTILINGGANVTNDPNVVLTLNATDGSSGVSSMWLANSADAGCSSLSDDTGWINYFTNYPWNLGNASNGQKYVCVRYRDGAGNESSFYSTNILLVNTIYIDYLDPDAGLRTENNMSTIIHGGGFSEFRQDEVTPNTFTISILGTSNNYNISGTRLDNNTLSVNLDLTNIDSNSTGSYPKRFRVGIEDADGETFETTNPALTVYEDTGEALRVIRSRDIFQVFIDAGLLYEIPYDPRCPSIPYIATTTPNKQNIQIGSVDVLAGGLVANIVGDYPNIHDDNENGILESGEDAGPIRVFDNSSYEDDIIYNLYDPRDCSTPTR